MKVLLLLLLGVTSVHSQDDFTECLTGWYKYEEHCYKFVGYPRLQLEAASTSCRSNGATLVSINSVSEHAFITNWLEQYDGSRDTWSTSGFVTKRPLGISWQGDGTSSTDRSGWHDNVNVDDLEDSDSVIYSFNGVTYKWSVGDSSKNSSFICEIHLQDIYKILEKPRDFAYGLDIEDAALAPRGPYFLKEPEKTTILTKTPAAFLDCIAEGDPKPEYTWWFGERKRRVKLKTGSKTRFVMTGGQLTIINPSDGDEGVYQCQASNKFGSILSKPISLSFGSIDSFSNVESEGVVGQLAQGRVIECPPIRGRPVLRYSWYKQKPRKDMVWIRSEKQKHIFASNSGRLYFSELGLMDTDYYYCQVQLTTIGGTGNYVGSDRKQIRTSLPVFLNVSLGVSSLNMPVIPDDFIAPFPSDPKRGQTVRLECFAYGATPLNYQWFREDGKEFPRTATFSKTKRVMTIVNAQLEDSGNYRCRVDSPKLSQFDEKTYFLNIKSDPYFSYPLSNQHVDTGSRLAWHCEARGKPIPTITWYKNSEPMQNVTGITIVGNTMVIDAVDKERDSGMYQCAATNLYGITFSSAQIRVIEFAPTFEKHPVDSSLSAAVGGNITIICDPEAAPNPTYQWLRNGQDLGLAQGGSPNGNFQMLFNGNLLITNVNRGHQGEYTCKVTNRLGEASSSGILRVFDGIVISQRPKNVEEPVNETASIVCAASAAPNIDFVYVWKFNDHIIDFKEQVEYRMGSGFTNGNLFVVGVQYKHDGWYTCEVTTGMDSKAASAKLTVKGPPGEPSGLRRGDNIGQDYSEVPPNEKYVRLYWSDGLIHGSNIVAYIMEFRTNLNKMWRVHPAANPIEKRYVQSNKYPDKNTILLTQLKPYASHEFRVRAINAYGVGEPSLPTEEIFIEGSAPIVAPSGITGGGGKVGDLTIRWTPLPVEDYNGRNFKYRLHWRAKPTSQIQDSRWREKNLRPEEACEEIPDIEQGLISICSFTVLVGKDNYYLPYEARLQGINDKGDGVLSGIQTVMSADGMPSGTPRNVYAAGYNATAIEVYWTPVPNTRAEMKGRLTGYRINYWNRDTEIEEQARFNIISVPKGLDNIDRGLIIGLTPGGWYLVNVQAINSAGYGPKSEKYPMETANYAPALFPTEVHVYSIEGVGVQVNFRGISTLVGEEPLMGYKLQYWPSGENIRKAQTVDTGRNNYGVIRNVSESVLYRLRVYGYSRGGQGARSSPTVYFTVGAGQVPFNPETTEVMAGGTVLQFSLITLLCSLLLSAAIAHCHHH